MNVALLTELVFSFFLHSCLSVCVVVVVVYVCVCVCTGELAVCRDGETLIAFSVGISRSYVNETIDDEYFYSDAQLTLSRPNVSETSKDHCIRVEWTGISSSETPLMDCFDMGSHFWYGGYETLNQTWPINDSRPMTPFVPTDYISSSYDSAQKQTLFGPIIHPLWISSQGAAVFIDREVPLHVSINDPKSNSSQICLQALPYTISCVSEAMAMTSLSYTVCSFANATAAAIFFLQESGQIQPPSGHPDLGVFKYPIWSTWASFNTDINQSKIVNYARNITQYGFNISQLEIDDMYSSAYGDLDFSEVKFPNYSTFISDLSALGIEKLTAWVTPFISADAAIFTEALTNGRLIPGSLSDDTNSVSLVKWWNGYGGAINFLNDSTREWHAGRLHEFIINYSLVSLKFDAGEETYIPRCVHTEGLTSPTDYTSAYAEFVGSQPYASRAEMRSAYFNQDQPIFFRQLDRASDWSVGQGLKSVLTSILALSIAGYPFVLPDMIGGNDMPSPELFIRWVQLNAFLPVMQISVPPWNFIDNSLGVDIVELTKNMTRLHLQLVETHISQLIIDTLSTGQSPGLPIIRPLWWLSPLGDSQMYTTDDEFLIGDDLLVAPILEEEMTKRSVVFPPGEWKCQTPTSCKTSIVYNGNTAYDPFTVSITDVLYFTRS